MFVCNRKFILWLLFITRFLISIIVKKSILLILYKLITDYKIAKKNPEKSISGLLNYSIL